jgi:hypothetical protein
MKIAIFATEAGAKAIQSADNAKAGLPLPGYFHNGKRAPDGWGVTTALYDVTAHPDGKQFAYPVDEKAITDAKAGDPIKAATIVDKLDATWTAAVAEAPKEEPIEEAIGK